mgnify:FL=1
MAGAGQGVVQVNESGLFDSIAHTQGGVTHLMQLLWDEYLVHLRETIEKRTKAGKPSVSLTEAIKRAPATDFAKFCADYLAVHRPVQSFFIDENMGLMLRNQKSVAVSPGVEIRGTMQDAGAVQVTEGVSQEGLNGVVPGENLSIRI